MIVVTGGLGFIGKNLVEKLQEIVSLKSKICVVDKKDKFNKNNFNYYNNLVFLENLKNKKFGQQS